MVFRTTRLAHRNAGRVAGGIFFQNYVAGDH